MILVHFNAKQIITLATTWMVVISGNGSCGCKKGALLAAYNGSNSRSKISVFSTAAPSFIFLPTDGSTVLKNNKTGWGWPPCGRGIVITQITLIAAGHSYLSPDTSLKSVQPFPSKSVTCSFCQIAIFVGRNRKRAGARPQGSNVKK